MMTIIVPKMARTISGIKIANSSVFELFFSGLSTIVELRLSETVEVLIVVVVIASILSTESSSKAKKLWASFKVIPLLNMTSI